MPVRERLGKRMGGLGSVQGDGNSSTLTYNVGGAAAGIDYRFDPRFLVGLGVGYTARHPVGRTSFMGQRLDRHGERRGLRQFTPGPGGFYADALAGYAYSGNQMQRQIQIPGLQQRTATGSTGANQFLGQVETGYQARRLDGGGQHHAVRAPAGPASRRRTPSRNGVPIR